jgi:hypothetical protein
MIHLRLVHSAPVSSPPPHVFCTVDLDAGSPCVTGALLDAAKLVPRQPEVVRARAIVRARAALATEVVFAAVPAIRSRGLSVSITMITCAAFAIGAAGSAAALHGRQQSLVAAPAATAAPAALASTPPPKLADTRPATSAPPTSVDPRPMGRRTRPRRAATATAPHRYAAEIECLQRAQVAFAGRDFTAALAATADHARRFPSGWLAEEREALRVKSLAGAGRGDQARRVAAAFGGRFPRSALWSRLQDTTEAD